MLLEARRNIPLRGKSAPGGRTLLDMRMPVLDGHAVHEAMRQRESTLAVVFLTGHGDVPMAVEQMKRGAVDFCKSRFPPRLCKRR